jgi:hypothetical protein
MSDIHDGAFSVFGKPGNTVLSGLIWDDLPRQGGLCRTSGLACKSIAALTCPFIARLLNEDRVFRSNNKLILKTCLGEEHRDAFPSRSGGFYFQWSGFRAAAREVVLPAPATPSSPRDSCPGSIRFAQPLRAGWRSDARAFHRPRARFPNSPSVRAGSVPLASQRCLFRSEPIISRVVNGRLGDLSSTWIRSHGKTRVRNLRVVGIHSEVGEKKRFPARFVASAVRFDGHEYSVNLCKGFRIFRL